MSAVDIGPLRDYLDGGFVSVLATAATDGTPNVSVISDVRYVDERHVALSFQFFNKTHANISANPRASLQLTHPTSGARQHLTLRYLRTETEGPLFEAMKAKLAGIASHVGMTRVFRLRGADVYEVLAVQQVAGPGQRAARSETLLTGLRDALRALRASTDVAALVDATLEALHARLGYSHCMLLAADAARERVFAVGSAGYPASGVGAEIAYGAGIIGVAARERSPIRITHMTSEYRYGATVREQFAASDATLDLEREIPLPGLAESRSQLAMPIVAGDALVGVLYLESPLDAHFAHADEEVCGIVADAFAARWRVLSNDDDEQRDDVAVPVGTVLSGTPLEVAHDMHDHSVFIDRDYLIKGVAGAVLWRMLNDHATLGRVEFTNRELRRDGRLGLPDFADNLEARLVLLQRRLAERDIGIHLDKIGRGRYRLRLLRPLSLEGQHADERLGA